MTSKDKRNMKKVLISVLIPMVFAGCSKLDEVSQEIHYTVDSVSTKATATTTESINQKDQTFAINAYADSAYQDPGTKVSYSAGEYFSGLVAKHDGTKWNTTEAKYWINGVNLRFWSYAPVTAKGERTITAPGMLASKLSFTYKVPAPNGTSDATDEEDLIFAYNSEIRSFSSDGTMKGSKSQYVDIHFYHALSQIMFAVSPDDGSFDVDGLEIESIKLANTYDSASCEFNGEAHTFTWSSYGSKTDYAQTLQAGFKTLPDGWTAGTYKDSKNEYKLYNCTNAFFMIPQSVADVKLSVTFKRLSDNTTITKDITLDGQWQAGKYYKYKISAKTLNNTILFGVTVTEWKEGEINIDVES